MLALRRAPRLLARPGVRFTSNKHDGPHHPESAGHHADHAPAAPESFGKGFYISIAALLGALAIVKLDQSMAGEEGTFITRMIKQYHSRQEYWEARNTLHTKMIEQAAADRSLFHDSPTKDYVELKYPEVFNMGSPWNRMAGWATGDLEAVKEHLEKQRDSYVPRALRKE